jgi:transposase-like protein
VRQKEGENKETLFRPKVVLTIKEHNMAKEESVEKTIHNIRRQTRKKYSAEDKIRIVLEGLRGETGIAELCRREGINSNLYYRWSKEFLEAGKQGQEQLGNPMQATIEAAFREHIRDISMVVQETTSHFVITPEVQHSDNGSGHHFCIAHLALPIFVMVKCLQEIVTQAKYCYNLAVHVFLRLVLVWSPKTLPEMHGLFTSVSQGGNLG